MHLGTGEVDLIKLEMVKANGGLHINYSARNRSMVGFAVGESASAAI
jgi:hypothetical protein